MREAKITLLGNPISTQNAYGQRGKIRYMKQNAKQTKESYIQQVISQYKGKPTSKVIEADITLYFRDRRRRDRDNRHKISMDSMEGIVYDDDKQIEEATIRKRIDKDNPRIEILLREI